MSPFTDARAQEPSGASYEEALRASEESYRTIFELAGDPLFVFDAQSGRILDANRKACELRGTSLDELKTQGLEAFTAEGTSFNRERAIRLVRLAAEGQPQRFEWLIPRPGTAGVWVEVNLDRATILGERRVIASVRSVQHRKAAEDALQRSYLALEQRVSERTQELAAANRALESEIAEHRAARAELLQRTAELEGVFQALPDVYLRLNADGVVTDYRQGSDAELYPLPDAFPPELVGRSPRDYMPRDIRPHVERAFREVQRTGRVARLEYPLEVRGETRSFETRITPLPDGGVIAIIRDMTERTRAESALAQAKEEAERAREAAERANRAKSEFLSRMSHELRTPMNSILGFAQVLARAELTAKQAKSVQHILKAGNHLLQLINEVLEIARIESGRHNLSLEPVRIGAVLQEAIGLVRPLASQWGISLEEATEECEDLFVQADRQRLTQVLLNLLSNAIKYNRPAGSVRLSCGAGGGGRLAVRVEDTGRGIAPDRVPELFTPFARLGAEHGEVEGTGLGLALSQRLTEAMGGSLELESTSEDGSVFLLELQLAESPLQRFEDSGPIAGEHEQAPHSPATLLYVEDNLANLSLLETILDSRPKWRMIPALQGQLGVEMAREHTPDVILLDIHLPDIPGDEVLRRLRSDERTAAIPVVVISADATQSTVERLLAGGAAAFLTKPLDVDEFLRTLERFLSVEQNA